MRKNLIAIIATAFLCAGSFAAKCQWSVNVNDIYSNNVGNVGIGTATPDNSDGYDKVFEVKGYAKSRSVISNLNITAGMGTHYFEQEGILRGGVAGTWSNDAYTLITNKLGRMTITATGNVGINTMYPTEKLHVAGNAVITGNAGIGTTAPENAEGWDRLLEVSGYLNAKSIVTGWGITSGMWSNYYPIYGAPRGGGTGTFTDHPFSLVTNKLVRMTIMNTGNVGIGTTTPLAMLHVNGGVAVGSGTPSQYVGTDHAMEIAAGQGQGSLSLIGGSGTVETWDHLAPSKALLFGATHPAGTQDGSFHVSTYDNGLWTSDRFLVDNATGNVGIGTTTPAAKLDVVGNIYSSGKVMIGVTSPSIDLLANYSLAVNGSALFTKAIVKLNVNWPDYVFSKNYKLPTLPSVEKYINENSHLPGVASAQEVEKNGVDLGDNQAVLLKKVEELTLYMIDMDKKMQQVQKENAEMKAENKDIKMELENLKAKN